MIDNEVFRRNTVEVIPDEITSIPKTAYVGFEPSGKPHLGWLIIANKIRDLQQCGIDVSILLADWHAYINDKFNGDLNRIKECGKQMEDTFHQLNVHPKRFIYASDYIGDKDYWATVIKVAKTTSMQRMKRAMTIMGREENEADLDCSKMLYPAMQVADIFHFNFDVAIGGLDQRHAHMLAMDVAPNLGFKKPIAIHTPILPSLSTSGRMDAKMSKSKPNDTIFLSDSPDDIKAKIKTAFCEPKNVDTNPLLAIVKHVIFPIQKELNVERSSKFGGDVKFTIVDAVRNDFADGRLHPSDLKNAVSSSLVDILGRMEL